MFSVIKQSICQATEYTIIIIVLKIFYCRGIKMEINQICFFGTSNGNMKYNFIGVVFTRNVSLKQHVVKSYSLVLKLVLIRFSSIEKYFFDRANQPSNLDIYCFILFLFLGGASFSSVIDRLILEI